MVEAIVIIINKIKNLFKKNNSYAESNLKRINGTEDNFHFLLSQCAKIYYEINVEELDLSLHNKLHVKFLTLSPNIIVLIDDMKKINRRLNEVGILNSTPFTSEAINVNLDNFFTDNDGNYIDDKVTLNILLNEVRIYLNIISQYKKNEALFNKRISDIILNQLINVGKALMSCQ